MASRPDIVHILYSGVGGEAGVVFPLAQAASAHSRQHAIFFGIEPAAQANIRQCEALDIRWHGVQKQQGIDRRAQQEVTRLLLQIRPAAVIVHTLGTLPACLQARRQLRNLKIIAVEHHSNALKNAKRWLLSLFALWRADRVVYLTENYRKQVASKLRWLFRARAKKTVVINNSLNLALYQRANPTGNHRFLFGMQGRMVDGKDFPTLLRALVPANENNPRPIHLELVGDGPLRPALEALAKSLRVEQHVTFCGMLSSQDLIARMQSWHAYAHASMGETMSIAIMEAKACGLPIIATSAPGVTEFFNHGHNGLVVPQGDFRQVADAVRELQRNDDLRRSLGQNARHEAESRYSSTQAWQAYADLIESKTTNASVAINAIHQLPI